MKKILILIILILILPLSNAQLTDYNNYNNLNLNFNLEGGFSIIPTGGNAEIEDLEAFLTFFPQDDNQQKVQRINFYSQPISEIRQLGDEIKYYWKNPDTGDFVFGVDANLVVNNVLVIVDKKVPFPIEETIEEYTQPTEFIDITPEISAKAQELATGEDDLYEVTFKIAVWVEQNIEYDLNTLTAETVQKSSWVLENEEGVCDELTNLFISMMRSLGVPARFVSGMAYTNIGNKWGPHGWAEVYFPGEGWVPFDVTYRQFGWLDPTHIKLKVSEDSGQSTARYSWKSHNTRIEGKEINITTNVAAKGNKISPVLFKIKPLVNKVGPGSYVPIEVEITNSYDYYFPTLFTVTKATELTEANSKAVLAKPEKTEKIFWITKIPENLEEGYIYISTIEVADNFHNNKSAEITYSGNFDTITLKEAEELINDSESEEKKIISKKLDLVCSVQLYSYVYENLTAECSLKNMGNINLKNIKTCYEEDCKTIDLGIAQQKRILFDLDLAKGQHNIEISSIFNNHKATETMSLRILENPGLTIKDISYPESMNYKEEFNITMDLITESPVKDLNIKINDKNVISIPELEITKTIIILANSEAFFGKDNFILDLEFKDSNGIDYNITSSYPIEITNVPWYVKILNLFSF